MNDSTKWYKEGDMAIVLNVEGLLSRLEAEELARPPGERRQLPSIPEMAAKAGVHRATMYNLVKGHVKQVNLELLSVIYAELRERGFKVHYADLLTMHPAEAIYGSAD
jgi:hypothetical protein